MHGAALKNLIRGAVAAVREVLTVVKRRIVFALVLAVVGCGQNRPMAMTSDPCSVVVEPGHGVTNVLAIGMTFAQVKKAIPGSSMHGPHDGSWSLERLHASRFTLIPDLGAIGALDENKRIAHLEFYVRPHYAELIPGLVVRTPFCGTVGRDLSFKEGSLRREDVERAFGEIGLGTTNAADIPNLLVKMEPYWFRRHDGIEELNYKKIGLTFNIESNFVSSFRIYRPTILRRP